MKTIRKIMEQKNKVVVITGASRGLGKALAGMLVAKGCKVVISSRDKKELKKAAEEIGAVAIAADVTKEKGISQLAQRVVSKYGQIDIWINNAGIWVPHVPVEELDMKRVHQMMEVNLFGTIYGSRSALLQMKKQSSGTIVNIISSSALAGRPKSSGYAASKFAARGFTESLREELREAGVKVVAVFPGGMKTHFFDEGKPADIGDYMSPEFVAQKIVENLEQESPEETLIIKRLAK